MAAQHRSAGSTQRRTEAVYSLTKYIPYPSVTHAGGQYLLAHYAALRHIASLQIVAPDIPLNEDALRRLSGEQRAEASLLECTRPKLRGLTLLLARLESVWAGSAIYWPVRRLFRSARAPWQNMADAQVIELQWSEMVALAPSLRERLPNATIVGVAHDIITQRLDRQSLSQSFGPRRALLRVAAARSRRREQRSFAAVDVLLVFSEKDAVLAQQLAPGARVEVVHPGLGPSELLPREPNADEPMVLFTGAMNRPENWQSVMWFLDHVWPTVRAEVPTARFVIAGANPPDVLLDRVNATERVKLTGFVESLEPWYAQASVFVAPLRTGAGVKFKTIDAMLRAVPIVTTTVGAEGIGDGSGNTPDRGERLFAAVTDDAGEFADAVVSALRDPDVSQAHHAQAWADGVYGMAAFDERIRELYVGLS